ncbi:hypothetical protein HYH03_008631 [Edaphochlamys debaryana]|uniref:Alcohol dehydrogenase-like N-terminal domain-containing protein n=1 Tax=Edaphochlamys debaryana TaxID=47281 RepID=A0A836BXW8_9CHLO|nr:hypothetical protein HYH03_008631 [Edaphochlamys debaryana]|eukprot:KAG2493211.1 hypothetical protein HYH03_008631 [Edaphochlamys debaryana]
MKALTFNHATGKVALETSRPVPTPGPGEVLIRVLRAGICSTDLQIVRGYVPGFNGVLGHEFVGVADVAAGPKGGEAAAGEPLPLPLLDPVSSANAAALARFPVGSRVVGEINCNDGRYTCADAIFQRNHAPGRSVLGIIGRDGCLAEYCTLPASNLHAVPPGLSDGEALFAEPLAAACRVVEQGLPRCPSSDRVAVIGDGKLGLLVAAVLSRHVASAGGPRVTLVGRHADKMALVRGKLDKVLSEGDGSALAARLAGQFDLVVEASGSAGGIRTALALTRPMGTVLLKSTVSTQSPQPTPPPPTEPSGDGAAAPEAPGPEGPAAAAPDAAACCSAPAATPPPPPSWAEITNDIVVNEKVLVGSRCGPFPAALSLMARDEPLRGLLRGAVAAELPLAEGEAALELAGRRGVLKVQVVMG